jgi:uncharacterized protein
MSRVVHFEITSKDPERTARFYAEALGWKVATWGGGEQRYWLVTTGDKETPGIDGGIMGPHFPQAVINTIEVESLAAATERIERAGGKKIHGPNEIPNIGTHSYFADPDGALFGVLQPANARKSG